MALTVVALALAAAQPTIPLAPAPALIEIKECMRCEDMGEKMPCSEERDPD